MPNWIKKSKKDTNEIRKIRNEERKSYYNKSLVNATNSHTKYTEYEIDLIMEHTIPDSELSKLIGRSVQAIQNKRYDLLKKGA